MKTKNNFKANELIISNVKRYMNNRMLLERLMVYQIWFVYCTKAFLKKEERQESRCVKEEHLRKRTDFCYGLRQEKTCYIFIYQWETECLHLVFKVQSGDNVVVSGWESIFQAFMDYMSEPLSTVIESEVRIKILRVYLWVALPVGGWKINRSKQKRKMQRNYMQ